MGQKSLLELFNILLTSWMFSIVAHFRTTFLMIRKNKKNNRRKCTINQFLFFILTLKKLYTIIEA